VASPRPVRITKSPGPARVVRVAAVPSIPVPADADPSSGATSSKRDNAPARARAWRIVAFYLVALAAMYLGFVLLELRGPGGGGTLVTEGLIVFSGIAAALACGGVILAIGPVPRFVEVSPTAVVVVEWTGHRRTFPALDELRVDVVRRYSAGLLSSSPVEAVELNDGRRRRTYQLTEGLLPEHRPVAKPAGPA
jgi:hypothetical protein